MLWDPDPIALTLPLVNHPIAWYGILFAGGFFLGFLLFQRLIRDVVPESERSAVADRMLWVMVLSTVVGARLGEVFFYDWTHYSQNPWQILYTWRGGLASHGAAVGILLGVCLFRFSIRRRAPDFTVLRILDALAIPTCLVGGFIRLGNFVNQEILGTPTDVPWAITFGRPANGGAVVSRHPAQLYEMFGYWIICLSLYIVWRRKPRGAGYLGGVFFVLVFGFRFLIENVKEHQSSWLAESSILWMGQWLSLPLILLGVILMFRGRDKTA